MDRFRGLGFSKFAARALNAGDLPLTRARSGLNDVTLLDRCCGFSGTPTDLPIPWAVGVRLLGFCSVDFI